MSIINYETNETHTVEQISLHHVPNGTNLRTYDHCQIWATNFDMVFEHRDALGAYHSRIVLQLISKKF